MTSLSHSWRGVAWRRLDEAFFHNLFGYMDSLRQQGQAPSIFQMLAFMDSADVVLADIPFGLGKLMNVVVGACLSQRAVLLNELDPSVC